MFQVGLGEAIVLVVLAMVFIGPDKLPKAASQAARTLRQLRSMANSAKQDLRDGLGPEFADFDPADLNPRRFVRKHLLEGDDDFLDDPLGLNDDDDFDEPELAYGERPPFDPEAT